MNCYLCNNREFDVRKGAVRDDPRLQILECTNCSLVALSSVQHIQSGHYENSCMHGDNLQSMEYWLREAEQDDQRRFEMLKTIFVNRKIMDFGCGAGGFLNKARFLASEVIGIELERRAREYWGNRIQIHGTLEHIKGGYDLITAFHVIEHLSDPRAILRELAACLNDDGKLVIEVPNSEDALLTLYDSNAFQHFTYWSQHLFLFNARSLQQLVTQAGLRVITLRQVQRYPLSNHLYWLGHGRPGGHQSWSFLDTPALMEAYSASLAAVGKCDTLIAFLEKELP